MREDIEQAREDYRTASEEYAAAAEACVVAEAACKIALAKQRNLRDVPDAVSGKPPSEQKLERLALATEEYERAVANSAVAARVMHMADAKMQSAKMFLGFLLLT